jgi:hypothetical protein
MLESVATNGATILTVIFLWSTLAWALTYIYMTNKLRRKQEVIEFLDMYIEEMEDKYGDVMDDYTDYYLDKEW